jgi:hypothetical protein
MKLKKLGILSSEQLAEIERLSGLFFDFVSISIVVEIDVHLFLKEIDNTDSQIYKAYFKGKLLAECEIRKSVIQLAKQGSGPAQLLALKMLNDMNKIENI